MIVGSKRLLPNLLAKSRLTALIMPLVTVMAFRGQRLTQR